MLTPVDLQSIGFNLKTEYRFQDMSMQQTDLLTCALQQTPGFLSCTGPNNITVDRLCNCYTVGELRIRDDELVLHDLEYFIDKVTTYKDKSAYHSMILIEHLGHKPKLAHKPDVLDIFVNIPNRRLVWQPPVTALYWAYVCFNFINFYHSRDPLVNRSLGGNHNKTLLRIMGYYTENGANLKNFYGWRKFNDISISVMEFVLRNKISELIEVLQYFWPDINLDKLNEYVDFLNSENIPKFKEWYNTLDDDEKILIDRPIERNEAYSKIIADTATITPDNYREILRKYTR